MVAKKISHPFCGLTDPRIKILQTLEQYGIKPGLDRIKKCLAALGNPQSRYPSIIVGGTNGKGSVASMIHSMLYHSDYRTGLYTSPHLVSLRERFKIDNRLIGEKEIRDLVGWVLKRIGRDFIMEEGITYFEFTTTMAFKWFGSERIDAAVLEVGMGGRLDATNIVPAIISVITTVGMDHTAHLGNTVEKIAVEKGGIIKDGGILVTGCDGQGLKILKEIADKKGSEIFILGRDFSYKEKRKDCFDYKGLLFSLDNIRLNLSGRHQIRNACLALASAEILLKKNFRITRGAVREGLRKTCLHGRFEIVRRNPTVVLDSAHNPSAAEALVASLREHFPGRKIRFVFGAMRDKDIRGILEVFAEAGKEFYLCGFSSLRAEYPGNIRRILNMIGVKSRCFDNVKSAYVSAVKDSKKEDVICISGSLYLVGEFIRMVCVPSNLLDSFLRE